MDSEPGQQTEVATEQRLIFRVAFLVFLFVSSMPAQDRSYARSMVISRYGIVATRHVQASQVGAQVLARGGSAADAAIAGTARRRRTTIQQRNTSLAQCTRTAPALIKT